MAVCPGREKLPLTLSLEGAAIELSMPAQTALKLSHQDVKRSNGKAPLPHEEAAKADIIIVGAGLAGSLAALVLARRGQSVLIIDPHPVYPNEFRCEKLNGEQLALLEELCVIDCISTMTQAYERILVVRGGRICHIRSRAECGISYAEMVNAVRRAWPSSVTFYEDRVIDIITTPIRQTVLLASAKVIEARLVILATGLGNKLNKDLGLQRRLIHHAHTLCVGFDIAPCAGSSFEFEAMTYFGERAGDRIAYATFFPTKRGMRVNLFSYHEPHDPWAIAFRRDPIVKLGAVMPKLANFLGNIQVTTPIQMRSIDLHETNHYHRNGIVLIGDAFRSSCPATGTGVTRILTDVRQLCLIHIPQWLASQGMSADKISSFYSDRLKCATDKSAARAASRSRSRSVETNIYRRIERSLMLQAFRLNLFNRN